MTRAQVKQPGAPDLFRLEGPVRIGKQTGLVRGTVVDALRRVDQADVDAGPPHPGAGEQVWGSGRRQVGGPPDRESVGQRNRKQLVGPEGGHVGGPGGQGVRRLGAVPVVVPGRDQDRRRRESGEGRDQEGDGVGRHLGEVEQIPGAKDRVDPLGTRDLQRSVQGVANRLAALAGHHGGSPGEGVVEVQVGQVQKPDRLGHGVVVSRTAGERMFAPTVTMLPGWGKTGNRAG